VTTYCPKSKRPTHFGGIHAIIYQTSVSALCEWKTAFIYSAAAQWVKGRKFLYCLWNYGATLVWAERGYLFLNACVRLFAWRRHHSDDAECIMLAYKCVLLPVISYYIIHLFATTLLGRLLETLAWGKIL
jgi:hypothetical protein